MQDILKAIFKAHSIENLEAQEFFGFPVENSLIQDHTVKVFKQLRLITTGYAQYATEPVYDIQIYPKDYFAQFNPSATFIKWAALDVIDSSLEELGLTKLLVPAGRYLCFHTDGREPQHFFSELYTSWLPQSDYSLDNRPHLDKMWPNQMKRGHILKQEVYIPIQ